MLFRSHEAFFKAVTVDPGGYGVSWDDEMDLSEYELWNNGVEVEPSTAWSKEGTRFFTPVGRSE